MMRPLASLSRRCLSVAVSTTAIAVAITAADRASAQVPGYSVNRFDVSERGSEWFSADSLDMRGKFRPVIGVVVDYAHRPQRFHNDATTTALLERQLYVHVGASFTFVDRLRLGIDAPILADQKGNTLTAGGVQYLEPEKTSGFGDLRFALDGALVGKYGDPFILALGARVWAPTGKRASYTGDEKVRFEPHVSIAGDVSQLAYALSLGFMYRSSSDLETFADTPIGSALTFRAAIGLRAVDGKLVIGPEVYGTPDVSGKSGEKKLPIEAILGAHYTAGGVRIGLGGGPGVSKASGTAEFRALASIEWLGPVEEEKPVVLDHDGDGVPDDKDACASIPGVATSDPKTNGCPPDKDGDGVSDDKDACIDKPGPATSDPKTNGCPPPPPDQDNDGISDLDDACPAVSGVKTEDPKTNGCPPDKDGDGIADDKDACLNVPGVKSDDPSKNGCPADKDGDGVPDDKDACPEKAGKADPDPKKNGCPEVMIEKGQIKILEQIKFKTGSAEILAESQGIITAVAGILKEHPEITLIRVEGHTDNQGNAKTNKDLSTKRAKSVVDALVKAGVEKKRLKSIGYGMDKPIDVNTTEEGKANNRRVEFHIEKGEGSEEPATPEKPEKPGAKPPAAKPPAAKPPAPAPAPVPAPAPAPAPVPAPAPKPKP
jgi:OmpA-OmpF porin, OOP family